jgi:hypothetical protein
LEARGETARAAAPHAFRAPPPGVGETVPGALDSGDAEDSR